MGRNILIGACILLIATSFPAASGALPTREIWSLAGGKTIARITLNPPSYVVFGTGIHDPVNLDDGGTGWTTLAMTPNRTLYLLRRFQTTDYVFSIPADNILVNGNQIITNLQLVGSTGLGGNLDGLTAGPDGNLYFSAYSATGVSSGQASNGLYRFRLSTKTTEYVGTFANNVGPHQPNSFYTDLAFDPISGDLVGTGFDPSGKFGLYRIPASVLQGVQQTFAWHSFFGVKPDRDINSDGIAFDPVTGDLYLSSDGGGVFLYDRNTGTNLGAVAGSAGTTLGWDLAYQVRGCAETKPIRALCVPGKPKEFNVTFEVTNHSGHTVNSVALADPAPPNITVSPNVLTGPPLPLGDNASALFTVLVQGATTGQTVCLRGALGGGKEHDCEGCCGIQTCVRMPECGCLQVYADSPPQCQLGNPGSFQYSFQIQNLGNSAIDHLFLSPASGGTLAPAYLAVPTIAANGGIDSTPRTITVSGLSPGQPFCFDVSAHDAAFTACCQKRICIGVPSCGDSQNRRPATSPPVPVPPPTDVP
ncbi:MAG TPA: hypothetical protein VEW48_20090 [Thermoanaerobaculia bacterium]|nr:hypothetical protein [Thermoanaerobaculia bacterium]